MDLYKLKTKDKHKLDYPMVIFQEGHPKTYKTPRINGTLSLSDIGNGLLVKFSTFQFDLP